ncbi:MAG: pyocin knob domain-containing S74 family peptidase [Luteimonas sp.]
MGQLFTNNATSTLAAGITAAATSLTLATGEGAKFPPLSGADDFLLTLFQRSGTTESNWEVVKVTARAGDVLTLVRAQEGTTARAYALGDPVELRMTAGAVLPIRSGALITALNEAPTVAIAGATAIGVGSAQANTVSITGTATITTFDAAPAGAIRRTVFAGTSILTHNAASLILIGAANITTMAGDIGEWVSLGGGNWRMTAFSRANGDSVGVVSLAKGGTGVSTAAAARAVFGVPATDGTGASGTWPIAVNGVAASAPLLTPGPIYSVADATLPKSYPMGESANFVQAIDGWFSYGTVVTTRTYADGGGTMQMYTPYSPTYGGSALKYRMGNYDVASGNAWTAWRTIVDSLNVGTYAPSLTGAGASGTWGINTTYSTNATRLYATGGGYGYGEGAPYYLTMAYNAGPNRWRLSATPATPAAVEVAYADVAGSATSAGSVPWGGVTGKPTTIAGYGITDFISTNSANVIGNGGTDNVANAIGYINGVGLMGQSDGALYAQAHSAPWQHQIYGDYRTGGMMVRGKNGGAWQPWYQVWDSRSLPMSASAVGNTGVLRDPNGYVFGNYINMTDEGVSGSTGAVSGIICKRGDQYYRTTTAGSVKAFLAIGGNDVNSVRTDTVSYVGVCREMAWKYYGSSHTIIDASAGTAPNGAAINQTNSAQAWTAQYPTLVGWNGSSTYGVRVDSARTADQLAGYTLTANATASTVVLRHTDNTVYAGGFNGSGAGLVNTAGSLTAGNAINISSATGIGYTWTGSQDFQSNGNTATAGPPGMLRATSGGGAGACMSFHRGGYYAINMGLDSDNVFRIGGWSAQANVLQLNMSGDLTTVGNITAYSDERLKTNWRALPLDFLAKVAQVKRGTYDRTDSGATHVGVGAQSLQKVMPEWVETDSDGMLSVNYGMAGAVTAFELAAEVVEMRSQLKLQADLIKLLMKKVGY